MEKFTLNNEVSGHAEIIECKLVAAGRPKGSK